MMVELNTVDPLVRCVVLYAADTGADGGWWWSWT